MPKHIYYYSPDCPACQTVTPLIKKLRGGGKHSEIQMVDVRNCGSDELCNSIKYIPTVMQCDANGNNCKEINLKNVPGLMDLANKKKPRRKK